MTAQTELTMEERNEETVRRFVREIVNGGNYDLADELFAEGSAPSGVRPRRP